MGAHVTRSKSKLTNCSPTAKGPMPFLIALTGIFFFPLRNMTDVPQAAYFVFSSGVVFSFLLSKKNQILGCLLAWASFIFLYTLLFRQVSPANVLDGMLTTFALVGVYLAARELRFREDLLRWFLVPAAVNIGFIFTQKFFPTILPFKGHEVCGLLGSPGLTATFLGMCAPVFLKYCRWGTPFLLLAIVLCDGFIGMLAFLASWVVYDLGHNKKIWKPVLLILSMAALGYIFFHFPPIRLRLAMWLGALDGILRHPFLGWGVGSFVEVMARVPEADSMYLGVSFNAGPYVMNHPANEFLYGWWNFGLPFFFLMILASGNTLTSFTRLNRMSYCILLAGFITMMGFMLTPPTLFLLAIALGIFENQKERTTV